MGNQRVCLLAYVTGFVNQALLLQNENPVAEDRILKAHLSVQQRGERLLWLGKNSLVSWGEACSALNFLTIQLPIQNPPSSTRESVINTANYSRK